MTARRPLVISNGRIRQLASGETLEASVSEVDVVTLNNGGAANAPIGSPVYISGSGAFQLARADSENTADVFGLVRDSTIAPGIGGNIQTDGILTATTAQWDSITGQTGGLSPGAAYFLSPSTAGRLTTAAPSAVGQLVSRVGRAVTSTAMEITIDSAILL